MSKSNKVIFEMFVAVILLLALASCETNQSTRMKIDSTKESVGLGNSPASEIKNNTETKVCVFFDADLNGLQNTAYGMDHTVKDEQFYSFSEAPYAGLEIIAHVQENEEYPQTTGSDGCVIFQFPALPDEEFTMQLQLPETSKDEESLKLWTEFAGVQEQHMTVSGQEMDVFIPYGVPHNFDEAITVKAGETNEIGVAYGPVLAEFPAIDAASGNINYLRSFDRDLDENGIFNSFGETEESVLDDFVFKIWDTPEERSHNHYGVDFYYQSGLDLSVTHLALSPMITTGNKVLLGQTESYNSTDFFASKTYFTLPDCESLSVRALHLLEDCSEKQKLYIGDALIGTIDDGSCTDLSGFTEGQIVPGQIINFSGSTGGAPLVHIHEATRCNDLYTDPYFIPLSEIPQGILDQISEHVSVTSPGLWSYTTPIMPNPFIFIDGKAEYEGKALFLTDEPLLNYFSEHPDIDNDLYLLLQENELIGE